MKPETKNTIMYALFTYIAECERKHTANVQTISYDGHWKDDANDAKRACMDFMRVCKELGL